MKHTLVLPLMIGAVVVLAGAAAFATNITIYDENSVGSGKYGPDETVDVEPGAVSGPAWNLQAFDLVMGGIPTISIIGTYNPAAPDHPQDQQGNPGDLFIDVDGDATFGNLGHADPAEPIGIFALTTDLGGYDYAVDLDWVTDTYTAYKLVQGVSVVRTTGFIWESDPLRLERGGQQLATGTFTFTPGAVNTSTIDLAWLVADGADPDSVKTTYHFTMGCGNDDLMGRPVPEPATLSLLGLGLLGAVLRKRFWA